MKKYIFMFLMLALLLASCDQGTNVSDTESKIPLPQTSTPAEVSAPEKNNSAPDIDISLPDDTSSDPVPEIGGTAQEGEWGKYTFISEENGLTVAGIYTTEQVNEFNQKRENGEWFVVTEEDLRFLLDDTVKLFTEYDIIRITDINGNVKSFAGVGYYSTEKYYSLFNKVTSLPEYSFCLDNDIVEALITRIEVIYPLVLRQEDIVSSDGAKFDMSAIMVCGYESALGREEYKAICGDIAHSYVFNKLSDKIKNNTRTAVFFENGVNLRKVNTTEEPENIFLNCIPNKPYKYEYATDEKSVVIELYDEQAQKVVALVRITDEDRLAEIERMWVALFDNCGNVGFEDNTGVDKYRVCVHLNGFPSCWYSSVNLCSFFYRYGENNDAWSTYSTDNFASNMFHLNGCKELASYLDKIIYDTIGGA